MIPSVTSKTQFFATRDDFIVQQLLQHLQLLKVMLIQELLNCQTLERDLDSMWWAGKSKIVRFIFLELFRKVSQPSTVASKEVINFFGLMVNPSMVNHMIKELFISELIISFF